MSTLDADLIAYYDEEARRQTRVGHSPLRTQLRERFIELLRAETRTTVLDVGSGPGLDSVGFARRGVAVTGIDLAPANAARMADAGVTGVAGSLYDLPFRDAEFDALWTMSTFVHVPDDRFDDALGELLRVVRKGAPVGIGTWGGFDWEGTSDIDTIVPARFFSLARHDRMRSMLAGHATVESFDTWHPNPDNDWEYQFAVLRV